MHRRTFLQATVAAFAAAPLRAITPVTPPRLNYLIASSLYGNLPLAEILPVVKQAGATAIELWPKKHGTQREELEAIGHERFAAMLKEHGLTFGGTTRFDIGPLRIADELQIVHKLGGKVVVVGSQSIKEPLAGAALKKAVAEFAEKLKPNAALAASLGIVLAIENHGKALLESPEALRWFAEMAPAGAGIALAPYHLPQEPALLAGLIRDIGSKLGLFYAWQHGEGASEPLPKEKELLQLPGRGPLDFQPLLQALREIRFTGPTEIFMHPTPRGIPILETAAAVSAEIARARAHLDGLLR